jgi:RNA polymerase-binding transcription factor DksA
MVAPATMGQQRLRLLKEMDQVRNALQPSSERCVQLLDGIGDTVDQANRTVQVGTDQSLRYVCEQELDHLEEAWLRCCEGKYGICKSCGGEIEPARLNVLPYATQCADCRQQSERQRHQDRR